MNVSLSFATRILKNKKGQSLVEFILFLPFLFILLSFMVTMGSSINGSINPQKAVRGYFHELAAGNSMLPSRQQVNDLKAAGSQHVGLFVIGWRDYSLDGGQSTPVAACYKLNTFVGGQTETCENNSFGKKSKYIKVKTAYGLCSTTYNIEGGPNRSAKIVNSGLGYNSCSLN